LAIREKASRRWVQRWGGLARPRKGGLYNSSTSKVGRVDDNIDRGGVK